VVVVVVVVVPPVVHVFSLVHVFTGEIDRVIAVWCSK